MIYEFKSGCRPPAGSTAAGIMAERARIERQHGNATTARVTDLLLSEARASLPNLAAWCPATPEEAMRQATAHGVRQAFASVVAVREQTRANGEPRRIQIRQLRPTGRDHRWEPLEVIARSKVKTRELIARLRKEAADHHEEVDNTLAEIEALITGRPGGEAG